ncbi:MAG: cell division protein FtsZ [bacterium]|jgi:cell division protein FtsZ
MDYQEKNELTKDNENLNFNNNINNNNENNNFVNLSSKEKKINMSNSNVSSIDTNKPEIGFLKKKNEIRFTNIKVVGVGGGGSNAVNRLVKDGIKGVDYIAINTDAQALLNLPDEVIKVHIGKNTTKGLGAGSDIELGRKAAEESKDEIRKLIEGSDMLFIAAGMGGGTGTGASPIIASLAKELGILTIAIVTKPFSFEGKIRKIIAEEGITNLKPNVDAMIVIPNDKLFSIADEGTTLLDSFKLADNVIKQGVIGITEIILKPGLINIDFADIQAILKDSGNCWMGIGVGKGENKAEDAAAKAVDSPLLEVKVEGAKRVLFNVIGGVDLTLSEVNKAANIIYQSVDPDAKIIFGATIDENLKNEVKVILIATDFVETPTVSNMFSSSKNELFGTSSVKQSFSFSVDEIPPFARRKKITFTE